MLERLGWIKRVDPSRSLGAKRNLFDPVCGGPTIGALGRISAGDAGQSKTVPCDPGLLQFVVLGLGLLQEGMSGSASFQRLSESS